MKKTLRLLKPYRRQLFWIGLGLLTLLLQYLAYTHPEVTERYYSRGVFLAIRWSIDHLLAWSPVALIYIFLLLLLVVIPWRIRKFIRRRQVWWRKGLSGLLSVLAFAGGGFFFFQLLWGFNYNRISIEELLGLTLEPLSAKDLREELEEEAERLIAFRARVSDTDSVLLSADSMPHDLENRLRHHLEHWLREYDFPAVGRVRGRQMLPAGIFLRFSSAGLYFPFTGEGHVDAGLHPLQIPGVMTHELAHGYGFADEGTCSFLAYLSCIQSDDPFIAYAAQLDFWRTLAVNYLRQEPKAYRKFRDNLPSGIRADLDAINQTLDRYPDIVPRLRYRMYDAYLKSQGIKEGMLNYNRVIMLVYAWKRARRS